MESNIGFFGQFKYVFKGVIKPRFFNRLSNQSNVCVVGYTIIALILSTAVFWGIIYLRCLGGNGFIKVTENTLMELPQFSYNSGTLTFEENTYIQGGDNTYYVFNSDIENADSDYINKVEILTDWSNGVQVHAFNAKSVTTINAVGMTSSLKYTDIANIIGLPSSFDREGFVKIFKEKFIIFFLIVAGASLIPFGIKAVAIGFIFGLLGFGIVKIIKQPYSYKELVKISLYITGFTNIIRSALNASPVKPPAMVLNIIFILIVGVYLFFCLTGSTEEAGPSSTIVFNKPSSKRLDEIPAPDPFEKKNYSASAFSRKTASPAETPSNAAPSRESAVKAVSFAPKAETRTETSAPASTVSSASSATAATMFKPVSGNSSYTNTSADNDKAYSAFAKPSYGASETPVANTPFTFARKSEEEQVYQQPETTYADSSATYDTSYDNSAVTYSKPETAAYAEPEAVVYEEQPVYSQPETYYEPEAPVQPVEEAPVSAVVKSDIGTYGGLGQLSSSGGKKSKPKYDRPITAPDAYNGLYYSGSDSEESYESNYGSGTLLDRGGLYGKTIGAAEPSANPFASVLGVPTATTSTSASAASSSAGSLGGSLYGGHSEEYHETPHVAFTTKEGSTPFGNGGFYLSNPPRNGGSSSGSTTVKKGGKTVNRYSDDDFAAWERETYADEFNKPRGSFGNNIF